MFLRADQWSDLKVERRQKLFACCCQLLLTWSSWVLLRCDITGRWRYRCCSCLNVTLIFLCPFSAFYFPEQLVDLLLCFDTSSDRNSAQAEGGTVSKQHIFNVLFAYNKLQMTTTIGFILLQRNWFLLFCSALLFKTEDAALINWIAGILPWRVKEQVVARRWAEFVPEERAFRTQSIKCRW